MDEGAFNSQVSISATLAERVNFACQQNEVPLLRDLSLRNDSEGAFSNLTVEISSEPGFVTPRAWRVDRIASGDQIHISDLDVTLSAGVLWELSEAVTATVRLRVLCGETELATTEHQVELLARHEWGGAAYMPEMVASFVTPNDPAVERVLKEACRLLQRAGLDASLEGYQSGNPQRVAYLISAIWTSVGALKLSYSLPPASFERNGQKIRTPSHIIDSGLGTCLDLTLLFAACIEQAGLHPIIVFTYGHSFVGCWLKDEQFANVCVDDVATLRKRIQLGEALFLETTLATQEPAPKFTMVVKHAANALAEGNDERFDLAVDVRRARMQRIRPIPTGREPEPTPRSTVPGRATTEQEGVELDGFADLPSHLPPAETEPPDSAKGRLDRWQRKLLDLSLRNRLLNFKPSKRSIAIRCPDPARLEDRLADGNKIRISASPRMMDEAHGRSAQLHRQRHGEDADEAYAREALERDEVLVDLVPAELDRRLVELYRAARAARQEGGANTLFLAFGFLAWRKGESKEERRYRAPLILVPVSLERRSVRSGMRLVLNDDEARVNPTLLQMLEQDFRLRVPELADTLPVDDSGLDVRRIWSAMTRAVRDLDGWEVIEDVTLATFSFAKYLMWKDLVDRTEVLKESPIVEHLMETPKESYKSQVAFPDPQRLDHDYPPQRTFTPLPADSSQLSAVMAVAAGKDFVLEGPPGTGKSQTIANMIAQCLTEEKTVLFVSEKTAALDVVYRRLRDVGLGEFCLELHSSKARKIEVLEQLRSAWQARAAFESEEWQRAATRLAELRERLNELARHLHRRYANGLSPYDAIAKVVAGRDEPRVPLSWPSPEAHERGALDAMRRIVERIDVNHAELGGVAHSAFTGVNASEWSPTWQSELIELASSLRPMVTASAQSASAFAETCGLPEGPMRWARLTALSELAEALPKAYEHNYGFALAPQGARVVSDLRQALELLIGTRRCRCAAVVPVSARSIEQSRRRQLPGRLV